MRNAKSSRFLLIFVLSFVLFFQSLGFASIPPSEADIFLSQIPSSNLANLNQRLGGGIGSADKIFQMRVSFDPNQRIYQGNQYAYSVNEVQVDYSSQSDNPLGYQDRLFQRDPEEMHEGKYTPRGSKRSRTSQKNGSREFEKVYPRQDGIKKFVFFARCVIRSFYIVRFEANDDPQDPIGHDVEPDQFCPEDPQYYLDQATIFADLIFPFEP